MASTRAIRPMAFVPDDDEDEEIDLTGPEVVFLSGSKRPREPAPTYSVERTGALIAGSIARSTSMPLSSHSTSSGSGRGASAGDSSLSSSSGLRSSSAGSGDVLTRSLSNALPSAPRPAPNSISSAHSDATVPGSVNDGDSEPSPRPSATPTPLLLQAAGGRAATSAASNGAQASAHAHTGAATAGDETTGNATGGYGVDDTTQELAEHDVGTAVAGSQASGSASAIWPATWLLQALSVDDLQSLGAALGIPFAGISATTSSLTRSRSVSASAIRASITRVLDETRAGEVGEWLKMYLTSLKSGSVALLGGGKGEDIQDTASIASAASAPPRRATPATATATATAPSSKPISSKVTVLSSGSSSSGLSSSGFSSSLLSSSGSSGGSAMGGAGVPKKLTSSSSMGGLDYTEFDLYSDDSDADFEIHETISSAPAPKRSSIAVGDTYLIDDDEDDDDVEVIESASSSSRPRATLLGGGGGGGWGATRGGGDEGGTSQEVVFWSATSTGNPAKRARQSAADGEVQFLTDSAFADSRTSDCPICLGDVPRRDMMTLCQAGTHRACRLCTLGHIRTELTPSATAINCPECVAGAGGGEPTPAMRIFPQVIFAIQKWSNTVPAATLGSVLPLSENEAGRFGGLMLTAAMGSNEHSMRCPNPKCGATIISDSTTPLATPCPHCATHMCISCGVEWLSSGHAGFTCEATAAKLRATEDAKMVMESEAGATFKQCPVCMTGITHYRGHGCHHITCSQCRSEWCYVCCGPYPCPNNCPPWCNPDNVCDCADCPDCKVGKPCANCTRMDCAGCGGETERARKTRMTRQANARAARMVQKGWCGPLRTKQPQYSATTHYRKVGMPPRPVRAPVPVPPVPQYFHVPVPVQARRRARGRGR